MEGGGAARPRAGLRGEPSQDRGRARRVGTPGRWRRDPLRREPRQDRGAALRLRRQLPARDGARRDERHQAAVRQGGRHRRVPRLPGVRARRGGPRDRARNRGGARAGAVGRAVRGGGGHAPGQGTSAQPLRHQLCLLRRRQALPPRYRLLPGHARRVRQAVPGARPVGGRPPGAGEVEALRGVARRARRQADVALPREGRRRRGRGARVHHAPVLREPARHGLRGEDGQGHLRAPARQGALRALAPELRGRVFLRRHIRAHPLERPPPPARVQGQIRREGAPARAPPARS